MIKPLVSKAGFNITGTFNPEKRLMDLIFVISILPLIGPERYNKKLFLITYRVSNKTQTMKAVTKEIISMGIGGKFPFS